MSNPPPNPYNPNNPNNNRRLPSAWQPTVPSSSLHAANVGHNQHTQQHQQPQQSQSQSHYPPQQQPYSQQAYGQQQPQQGYNPYAIPHNPYYSQQQYYPPRSMPQQQTPAYQPPARERKALVVTDKQGNPIDLGNSKRTTTTTLSAAAAAGSATSTSSSSTPAVSSEAAGNKLREAALARIAETDAKKKQNETDALEKKKAEEEEAAAAEMLLQEQEKKKSDEEARKKAEEEEARKTAEEEVARKTAEEGAARKKAEEEEAKKKAKEDEARKKALGEAATKQAEEEAAAAEAMAKSANANGKRRVYSKVDLLRFRELDICCCRPSELPDMTIERGPSRGAQSSSSRNVTGSNVGGGNSWSRGQTAPPRRQSGTAPPPPQQQQQQAHGGGGGQWSRGQAPPPPVKQNVNNPKGGRGNSRGYVEPSFDFVPLVPNENRWRPQKNANNLVVAEKKVKSILNKMTKEKFDRLSQHMCEIPLESYETLNMMIRLVYEKAIDEPAFGDMYADLCVLLSQTAQSHTSSYVHFFKSDEESENGSPVVWRWSNDVSHDDAEIVGPFPNEDDAVAAALATSTSDPVPRGDVQLELVKLKVSNGVFIKVLKKAKTTVENEAAVKPEDGEIEEVDEEQFYVVFFPIEQAKECGQPMSGFFLTERECRSDASKNNSFRRSLLNQCQDEFNKIDIFENWKKEYAAYEAQKDKLTDAERKEKEDEFNFRKIKIKKQMLGNIKFIGQLYKKTLIKEKTMRLCIATLLKLTDDNTTKSKNRDYKDSGDTDLDEDDHEALGNMFTTIGKTIDTPAARDFMTVCFTKMSKFGEDKTLSSRVRFMYKDLIDLRANQWVPRRKEEKAKTLDEIRQDVEREERLQEQQRVNYMNNSRTGGSSRNNIGGARPNTFTRAGGGGAGGGSDLRRSSYDNSSRRQPKQQQTDEDGFQIVASRTSAPAARPSGCRDSARLSTNKSPPQTRTVSPPPVSSSKVSSLSAAASRSPASPMKDASEQVRNKSSAKLLTDDELDRRIGTIRSEYLADPSNLEELLCSVDELAATPDSGVTFVQKNADRMMDCKSNERKAIIALLALLFENKRMSNVEIENGLASVIEFVDSFVIDAPNALEYFGDLLAGLLNIGAVRVAWWVEVMEKNKGIWDSAMSIAERMVKETVSSFAKSFGKDNAQIFFIGQKDMFADLLGDATWNEIVTSILS